MQHLACNSMDKLGDTQLAKQRPSQSPSHPTQYHSMHTPARLGCIANLSPGPCAKIGFRVTETLVCTPSAVLR